MLKAGGGKVEPLYRPTFFGDENMDAESTHSSDDEGEVYD